MTLILTTTGILTAMTLLTGTAVLVAAVALTDIHEQLKQWIKHKIWYGERSEP